MDLTVPITGGTIAAALVGVLVYFIREKMKRWDKHVEECLLKAIDHAKLEQQVINIDEKIDMMETHIGQISNKLGIVIEHVISNSKILNTKLEM